MEELRNGKLNVVSCLRDESKLEPLKNTTKLLQWIRNRKLAASCTLGSLQSGYGNSLAKSFPVASPLHSILWLYSTLCRFILLSASTASGVCVSLLRTEMATNLGILQHWTLLWSGATKPTRAITKSLTCSERRLTAVRSQHLI